METGGLFLQGFLFAIWLAFIVSKDVVIPLMGKFTGKKPKAMTSDECPIAARLTALEPIVLRVPVLEVNLGKQETRIAEFADLLKANGEQMRDNAVETDRASTVLDNKLDMVLAELAEFRVLVEQRFGTLAERVKGVETHVELLGRLRRGSH